jgi:hypothetical protein
LSLADHVAGGYAVAQAGKGGKDRDITVLRDGIERTAGMNGRLGIKRKAINQNLY